MGALLLRRAARAGLIRWPEPRLPPRRLPPGFTSRGETGDLVAGRKHSQWSRVIAESKKAEKFFKKHSREPLAPGFGLSYAFLPLPPAAGPVAYFFRRFVSFWDALREWRVQVPPPETDLPEGQLKDVKRAEETIPYRREAADKILAALEAPRAKLRAYRELANQKSLRDNYEAAEAAIVEWCREAKLEAHQDEDRPTASRLHSEGASLLERSPKLRVAWELENTVQPLMWAYRDPVKFFREIAPVVEWPNFDPDTIGPFEHFSTFGALGQVLHEWGVAALLNPSVRAAFDAATPYKLIRILGWADAKSFFDEGRKPGAKDKTPRKRRVDGTATKKQVWDEADRYQKKTRESRGAVAHAVRIVAHREKRRPSTIRRRMSRASRKK